VSKPIPTSLTKAELRSYLNRSITASLSAALKTAIDIYEQDQASGAFDTIASIIEAQHHLDLPTKPKYTTFVANLKHIEHPYYYTINPRTGTIYHKNLERGEATQPWNQQTAKKSL